MDQFFSLIEVLGISKALVFSGVMLIALGLGSQFPVPATDKAIRIPKRNQRAAKKIGLLLILIGLGLEVFHYS